MARIIMRDIAILGILCVVFFTSISVFSFDLMNRYSLGTDGNYSQVYGELNSSIGEIYNYTVEVQGELEGDEGISDSSDGTDLTISRDIWNAVKIVFGTIPAIVNVFVAQVLGSIIGVDPVFLTAFLAIMIIIISFAAISVLVRKDS
ncbi:MAG: hypothetical protein CL811_12385 [Colwelliaceae bacterium]|jgi:hypothetical protein|nr:hypothetical protein [Colwelliaceae bacterium]|tara:strand:- start:501 stop:941 length:441 start_codon:yes stop_codon:yes gene_type:complete